MYRRYISGSPRAHVTLSGDVIGPIFPGDEPVSLRTMFPTGNGRSVHAQVETVTSVGALINFEHSLIRYGKGTDFHAFNLAANTWQLHYLRLTNQLNEEDGKGPFAHDVCKVGGFIHPLFPGCVFTQAPSPSPLIASFTPACRMQTSYLSTPQYRDVAKAVFGRMNVEYAAVMRRFSAHGHFRNWDHGRGFGRNLFALLGARFVWQGADQ